ncbi:MAG: Uma2 family endonuclease [Saprospiraceae bacterium]|jgi:Uma2 family endonuclease
MALQLNRKLFTVEEYHKLADVSILTEDDRVELINGEIITRSPINSTHAGTVTSLLESLFPILIKKATILCQSPIVIPSGSEPEPDIVVTRYKTDSYRSAHPSPKDIFFVIEVSDSTLEKDREVKHPLYASAEIPEYWIINLIDQQIEIHRQPKNGEYHFKQIISEEGTILASSVAFSIEYSDIFK